MARGNLLTHLKSRGPEAYLAFLEALYISDQFELLKKVVPPWYTVHQRARSHRRNGDLAIENGKYTIFCKIQSYCLVHFADVPSPEALEYIGEDEKYLKPIIVDELPPVISEPSEASVQKNMQFYSNYSTGDLGLSLLFRNM